MYVFGREPRGYRQVLTLFHIIFPRNLRISEARTYKIDSIQDWTAPSHFASCWISLSSVFDRLRCSSCSIPLITFSSTSANTELVGVSEVSLLGMVGKWITCLLQADQKNGIVLTWMEQDFPLNQIQRI